jgi:serine phosphatase RsbU (regulator of sigma subunit)
MYGARILAQAPAAFSGILFGQLQDQFVTAAYLWLDTEIHQGLHSAGGHPPLLCWADGRLERIESDGLVIGIKPDSEYPVRENHSLPPPELSEEILSGIRHWRRDSVPQHDDITLIVVDAV